MKLSECRFKKVYLDSISSSIELMDDFISSNCDFLILGTSGRFSLAVTRNVDFIDIKSICDEFDLTMTKLRRGDWGCVSMTTYSNGRISRGKEFSHGDKPQNLRQSLMEFEFEHENEKLQTNEIYKLKHPVLLNAQTSSDRTGYSWGGRQYGDASLFCITGVVASW